MDCLKTRKLLNAYMDAELPPVLTERVRCHLDHCSACMLELKALERLTMLLDDLPKVNAPASLTRRTRKAFRAGMQKPTLADRWHTIDLYLDGLTCGMAVVGFLIGLFVGGSLLSLPDVSFHSTFVDMF
jgi:predicted anti-sigma-YlaC factor YlaD